MTHRSLQALFVLIILALSLSPVGAQASPSLQQCEAVELYPGYPGYRGVVTGLVGEGDTACLADLEAMDPGFLRDAEDAINRGIARRLGIQGDIPDWTWEIWMAIGAERGYGWICFSCMWLGDVPVMRVGPSIVSPDDLRLLLADPYQNRFRFNYLRRHPDISDIGYSNQGFSDREMRVIASALWAGSYPTASQLIESADYALEAYACVTADRCGFAFSQLGCKIAAQGGHVPIPSQANSTDQAVLLVYGYQVAAHQGILNTQLQIVDTLIYSVVNDWTLNTAQDPNFTIPFPTYFASKFCP